MIFFFLTIIQSQKKKKRKNKRLFFNKVTDRDQENNFIIKNFHKSHKINFKKISKADFKINFAWL